MSTFLTVREAIQSGPVRIGINRHAYRATCGHYTAYFSTVQAAIDSARFHSQHDARGGKVKPWKRWQVIDVLTGFVIAEG